jgi:hypothetical protein
VGLLVFGAKKQIPVKTTMVYTRVLNRKPATDAAEGPRSALATRE